jgi:hypothetical protein
MLVPEAINCRNQVGKHQFRSWPSTVHCVLLQEAKPQGIHEASMAHRPSALLMWEFWAAHMQGRGHKELLVHILTIGL